MTMNIFGRLFQNCIPFEWEGVNSPNAQLEEYETHRYHLFDLSDEKEEYIREIVAFNEGNLNQKVAQLQRVQNPYQLGRFLVRTEQRRFRGDPINVVKYYHPLKNEGQLNIALEHNMDVRRYKDRDSQQHRNNNPLFYKTPREAYDTVMRSEYVLICNVLDTGTEGNTIFTGFDAEYMPIYVVKFHD